MVSYVFQPAGILVKVSETVILDPTNKGIGMFPHKKKHKTQRHYNTTRRHCNNTRSQTVFLNPGGKQVTIVNSAIPKSDMAPNTPVKTEISVTGEM